MAEEAKWYVVHTYSGYENKVKQNIEKVVENRKLQELIPEVRIPVELVTEVKDNKTTEVEKKLFPSYVLVKMILTDDSWYIVRNTRGVTGFVGPASKPVPLSDREVAALGVEAKKSAVVEVSFKEGDSVTVEFDEEEIINVDGEGFKAKKAEIKLIPQALNLIIPKGLTFFESS